MKRALVLAPAVAILVLEACGVHNEYLDRRRGFQGELLADASLADVPVKGFPVTVYLKEGYFANVEGELLAVDDQYVVVATSEPRTRTIPWSTIREVQIELVPSRGSEPAASIAWTIVGTAATISNGYFLVLTFPTFLISGIAVSANHGIGVRGRIMPNDVRASLGQFARFPQGLPRPIPRSWVDGAPLPPLPPPNAPVPPAPVNDAAAPVVDAGDDHD